MTSRVQQEEARALWLWLMLARAAAAVIARIHENLAARAASQPGPALSLDNLAAGLVSPSVPPASRWVVRRVGLIAKEEAAVHRLGLPERCQPSQFLPPNAIALIFEETPDSSAPNGRRIRMTAVREEGT